MRARATATKLGRVGVPPELCSTIPRSTRELRAHLTGTLPRPSPVSSLRASRIRRCPTQVLSLKALGRPDGAPAEVLVIALALVALDARSGGVVHALEPWITKVLAD